MAAWRLDPQGVKVVRLEGGLPPAARGDHLGRQLGLGPLQLGAEAGAPPQGVDLVCDLLQQPALLVLAPLPVGHPVGLVLWVDKFNSIQLFISFHTEQYNIYCLSSYLQVM